VIVSPRAERELAAMALRERNAVIDALRRIATDPSSGDLKKLVGTETQWRLRVGRWRMRLRFDNPTGTMYVQRVLPRGSAYRD
jgi:mRNA-degrading endonuclease RelE of RelBE toxin-antitoxin system